MMDIEHVIHSITLSLYDGKDIDSNLIENLSETIMLLPNIDKETELSLMIMFTLIGNNLNILPKSMKLFVAILKKYCEEYKMDLINNNKFSDIFYEMVNGGD